MIKVVGFHPKVTLDIARNGVFFFDGYGATGKSYLAEALPNIDSDEFCTFTLGLKGNIECRGNLESSSIVLFDRVDAYDNLDVVTDVIEKYSTTKCILLDFKDANNFFLKVPLKSWGFAKVRLLDNNGIYVKVV